MDVPYRPRSVSVRARLKSCESRLAAGTNASSAAGVATKPRAHSLDLLALAEEGGAPSKVERSTQSLDCRTLRGVGGATSEVGRLTQSRGDSSVGPVPTEASNAGTVLSNANASDSSAGAVPTEASNAVTVLSNANANEDMVVTGSGAEVGMSNAQTRGSSETQSHLPPNRSEECIVNMSNCSIRDSSVGAMPTEVSNAGTVLVNTNASHVDLDSSEKQHLFQILSQDTKDRHTQFELAVKELGIDRVVKEEGDALLQYAAQLGYVPIIQLLCRWGVDVNKRSCLTKSTPLLNVVSRNHLREELTKKTVKVLIDYGAKDSVNAENNVGDTALFMAIRRGQSEVFRLLLNEGANRTTLDEAGNTILHAAAEVNATEICREIMREIDINQRKIEVSAKNDDEQTAIHLAAMHERECLEAIITFLGHDCSKVVEWFSAEDSKGCTPLDIAAKAGQRATFEYMWKAMEDYSAAHIDVERRKLKILIEQAEDDPSQWQKMTDAIRAFPKRMLHKLLVEDAHGEKPSFQQLITASKSGTPVNMEHGQQEAVRAVLDKSLFGDRVIVTETLDGSKHTAQIKLDSPCESRSTNRSKGSNLTALCKSDFQVWDHQTVTLWLNQKLKTCGGIGLLLYCFLYWAFLGVASIALEAAANLNVTSEQLLDYSNAKNSQRQTLEIAAATMWFLLFILDLFDVIRFRLYYLKWFGVYPRIAVNLLFLALLVTRFCGHSSQWVLASLFVICAAVRAMEVFTVWKWSSVYLITLWIILRRELLKFLLIALLLVLTFSVAMRFAMQAERDQASKLQNSIPNNQSGLCDPVTSVLENGTNTSCTSTTPLTELLASKLLGSLESLHNIFYANFDSLVRGPRVLQDGAGLGGYKIFTAVIYFAFLGLVVLLLVSVFIAQANGCYNNVKDIADQMANYSCARLLTQTSTMLPEWLFNAITQKKCTRNTSSYVWSDWPCHRSCTCCTNTSFLRSIWQIIPSVLVTKASSLVKSKEEQRSIDDLKSDFDVTVKVMQEVNQRNFNALKYEMNELKDALGVGKFDALKSEMVELKSALRSEKFDALKSEMVELKSALRSIQRHPAGQHANQ